MKTNVLFKKFVALICCIAMCIPMCVVGTVAAEDSDVDLRVTMNVPTAVDIYRTASGSTFTNSGDWIRPTTTAKYQYKYDGENIIFAAPSGGSLDGVGISFYVATPVIPEISSGSYGFICSVAIVQNDITINGEKLTAWRVTLTFVQGATEIAIDEEGIDNIPITFTPGVQKYNVTFSITGDCTVAFADDSEDIHATTTKSYEAGNVKFTVTPDDAGMQPVVKDGSETKTAGEDGWYTVTVDKAKTIRISLEARKLTVTKPTDKAYVIQGTSTVTYGSSYTFTVSPNPGYNAPTEVSYTQDGKDMGALTGAVTAAGYQYMIEEVTDDIVIVVKGASANTYSVHLPTGTGYKVKDSSETENLIYNAKVTFKVEIEGGYQLNSVKANGSTIRPDTNGLYTVTVTADIDIEVSVSKMSYTVTYPTEDDVKAGNYSLVKGSTSVEYGSTCTFTVSPLAGFDAPTVSVNGTAQPISTNGQYTITITGPTEITVAAAAEKQYTITLDQSAAYTLTADPTTVAHGNSVNVTLTINAGYMANNLDVKVNGSSVTLTGDNNTYTFTISNVTENKTVTVSGVQRATYTVTLTPGDGYTLTASGSNTVTHGGTFTFTLSAAAGYDIANAKVMVDGNEIDGANGVYRIENVTGNKTVTVVIPLKNYQVTCSAGNSNVEFEKTVQHGGNYTFTVKANNGYRVTAVTVNGIAATLDGDNYVVYNVTGNLNIVVTTVENKLTITYVSNEKNHQPTVSSKTFSYTDLNKDNTALAVIATDCVLHEFAGWYLDNAKAENKDLVALIIENDASVSLVAQFNTHEEAALKALATMAAARVAETQQKDGKYRINFYSDIKVTTGLTGCLAEVAEKVTVSCGTLLANKKDYNFNSDEVKDAIINGDDRATLNDAKMMIYKAYEGFTECALSELESEPIILRVTSTPKNAGVSAAGWMVLNYNGKQVVIVGASVTPTIAE